tara:strand:+ start:391 stop:648 length:258 start_codon:yes stop_codon:yes gene_type:complete
MKYIIFNIISIFFINILLFLAINKHQIFIYILVSFLFLLLSFGFKKILNQRISNKIENNYSKSQDTLETAEDHPIIKSARKRLGK